MAVEPERTEIELPFLRERHATSRFRIIQVTDNDLNPPLGPSSSDRRSEIKWPAASAPGWSASASLLLPKLAAGSYAALARRRCGRSEPRLRLRPPIGCGANCRCYRSS